MFDATLTSDISQIVSEWLDTSEKNGGAYEASRAMADAFAVGEYDTEGILIDYLKDLTQENLGQVFGTEGTAAVASTQREIMAIALEYVDWASIASDLIQEARDNA